MNSQELIDSLETLFQGVSHLISINERLEKEVAELKKNRVATTSCWMTTDQVLEYIPTHPCKRVLYEWVRNEKIPFHKLQGSLIFKREEIDEWIIMGTPEEHPEGKAARKKVIVNP